MSLKNEWKKLIAVAAVFIGCFYMPVGQARFDNAVGEALHLVRWYAREHVLLCLVPAFFIAGAISVFVSHASVMKYLGAKANKVLAYGVASVSGSVLAVCSCTVLPLFAGIYKMGAGLGPACAFLYSGPAVNVLAIILTARILGPEMGIARAIGAVVFSIVIGLLMQLIFHKEDNERVTAAATVQEVEAGRPLWKNVLYFAAMVGILVFANWARSGDVRAVFLCCPGGLTMYKVEGAMLEKTEDSVTIMDNTGTKYEIPAKLMQQIRSVDRKSIYAWIYRLRWAIVLLLLVIFLLMIHAWFKKTELVEWVDATWGFAKQIFPLLLLGVLLAGFFLGRPGPQHEGIIPVRWVNAAVGGNSIRANLFAAVAGAFMYFATLTEVPILQGLMGAGMGKGPALALLLAGPALSLPSILVIRKVVGTVKTAVFCVLVIFMSTIFGVFFGTFWG
jgi:uncharacterized membrane protein YraQ (UPF0718 family)